MSLSLQRLENISCSLREALTEQNWTAIGDLDLQCRLAVDAAMVDVADADQLRASMEHLLGLYSELVTVCQAEQKRMAGEMLQVNQSHQGAKVYQLFG